MKKNNGFTLIEILATITILSIIMITAAFIIGNVIENSKRKSFGLSTVSLTKAANLAFSEDFTANGGLNKKVIFTFANSVGTTSVPGLNLNFNGTPPKSGNVVVRGESLVAASLHDGTYCATKDFYSEVFITKESEVDCIQLMYMPSLDVSGYDEVDIEINSVYTEPTVKGYNSFKEEVFTHTKVIKFNNVVVPSITTNQIGTYTIDYSLTEDEFTTTKTKTINIVDETVPVILGANDISITGAQVASFNPMAGITATDNSNGTVNITYDAYALSGVGVYFITYRATDPNGNTATPVVRRVTVTDSTNPVVAFGTNGNATYGRTRTSTVTVSDVDSGVQAASLEYQWTTSTTAPTLASFTLPFTNGATITSPAGVTGTYYLWVTATDQAGNNIITRTNVFNLDNTPPFITRTGSATVAVALGGPYSDAGATATDNIDGNRTANIVTTNPVIVNTANTYTVRYNVTDLAGNTATEVTRSVTVNTRTEYRYQDYSCGTCYDTCYNFTAANASYSCPGGYNLSGSTCNTQTYFISTGQTDNLICYLNRWSISSSGSCTGNCGAPCQDGNSGYGMTSSGCGQIGGACSPNNSTSSCTTWYTATCNRVSPSSISANASYSCSSGTLVGAQCRTSYSCNPYSCGCSWSSWSGWSTTVYTSSGSRNVETRIVSSI